MTIDKLLAEANQHRAESIINDRNFQLEQALAYSSRAIELSPTVDAYFTRAFVLVDLGRYDEAVRDLTEVIKLEPENAIAYTIRGYTYNHLGKFNQAIEDLTIAREFMPKEAIIYASIGDAMRGLGNHENSIFNYKLALQLVEAKPIEQRTPSDYFAVIRAERVLLQTGINTEKHYEREALGRGILAQQQVDSIR